MIRSEKAAFVDKVLRLFESDRIITKKEIELKYKDDSYTRVQTEIHLKILIKDGLVEFSQNGEYKLLPAGLKMLNDIENSGYLARHKKDEKENYQEDDEECEYNPLLVIIEVLILIAIFFLDELIQS